jgi:hypothetical protein
MSTQDTGTSKTAEDRRYSDICGATNNRGDPCKLPAGWGTPGSGGTRCKFHGGCSTGPDDTTHLEDNDYAEGNDGGAPVNNDNAAIHGGFSDWRTAYERFQEDNDARERIETLERAYLETASEHAGDLDDGQLSQVNKLATEEKKQKVRELATRRLLKQRAQEDVWSDGENSAKSGRNNDTDARGLLIEDGDGRTVNPAHIAAHQHKQRTREIAEELSLWAGFQ